MQQAGPQRPEELLWSLATFLEPEPRRVQSGAPCRAAKAALTCAALALRHVVVYEACRAMTWNPTSEIRTAPAEQKELNERCSKVIRLLSGTANNTDTRREIRHLADYFHRLSGGMPISGPGGSTTDLVLGTLEAVIDKATETADSARPPECLHFELLDCELRAGQSALKALQHSLIDRPAGPMEFYFLMDGRLGDKAVVLWRYGAVPLMESIASGRNAGKPGVLFPPIKTNGQGRTLGRDGKPLPGQWYGNDGDLLADLDATQPPAGARWRLGREMDAESDRCELPEAGEHLRAEARNLADACRTLQRMICDKARREREARRVVTPAPPQGKSLKTLVEEGSGLMKLCASESWILERWPECEMWTSQVAQALPSDGLRAEWAAVALTHACQDGLIGAMLTDYMQKRLTWLGQVMQRVSAADAEPVADVAVVSPRIRQCIPAGSQWDDVYLVLYSDNRISISFQNGTPQFVTMSDFGLMDGRSGKITKLGQALRVFAEHEGRIRPGDLGGVCSLKTVRRLNDRLQEKCGIAGVAIQPYKPGTGYKTVFGIRFEKAD